MRRSGAVLLSAFIGVVLSFTASVFFTQWKLVEIDSAVGRIAGSSVPSIRDLDAARSSLRHLQQEVQDYVEAVSEGRPADRKSIEDERAFLVASLQQYSAANEASLPPALRARLDSGMLSVAGGIDRVLARAEAHDLPGAHSRLLYDFIPADERLDDVVIRVLELNVRNVYADTQRISRVRQRSFRIALLLDAICALVTVVAAWLAYRTTRDYARILERHAGVLERRSEELELFANRVAHDILSPLTSVAIAVDVAGREMTDEKSKPIIARGASSLRNVKRIVDDLLAFARAGASPDPGARADVREVLEATLAEVHERARDAGITIDVKPFDGVQVAAAPGVLASLVSNLVVNAIKYMGDATERRISLRVYAGNERVRIEVEDTGCGIPSELHDAIFQPYVRVRSSGQPGIGLGLATVLRVARAHRGEAGLWSSPGKGSCFWIEIPRAK